MPITAIDRYEATSPELRQGDVFADLLMARAREGEPLILRPERGLIPGIVDNPLLVEPLSSVPDAFKGGRSAIAAALVFRGPAMIISQDCSIADESAASIAIARILPYLAVVPEDNPASLGNLRSDRFSRFFYLPPKPESELPESVVDFGSLFSVPVEMLGMRQSRVVKVTRTRVTSLSNNGLGQLQQKLADFWGRPAAMEPGEIAKRGGRYRCIICSQYKYLDYVEISMEAGDQFPECERCAQRSHSKRPRNGAWKIPLDP